MSRTKFVGEAGKYSALCSLGRGLMNTAFALFHCRLTIGS